MSDERDEDVEEQIAWDTGVYTCWCGAKGTIGQLFDDDYLADSCGGSGELICYCGGD